MAREKQCLRDTRVWLTHGIRYSGQDGERFLHAGPGEGGCVPEPAEAFRICAASKVILWNKNLC